MNNAEIFICTHDSLVPVYRNENYVPLLCGHSFSKKDSGDIITDDKGDNISAKNKTFCELTAQYWVWKNIKDVDYVGFIHYRRYFKFHNNFLSRVFYVYDYADLSKLNLTLPNMCSLFKKYDVVLPKPDYKPYSIEILYNCNHYKEDLDLLREIVAELFPDYLNAFSCVMGQNRFYSCNMFIMPWCQFSSYCNWLFPILFEMEKRLDISSYSPYQARVFGFLGEWLLNVYIHKNGLKRKEYPIFFFQQKPYNMSFLSYWYSVFRARTAFFFQRPWFRK